MLLRTLINLLFKQSSILAALFPGLSTHSTLYLLLSTANSSSISTSCSRCASSCRSIRRSSSISPPLSNVSMPFTVQWMRWSVTRSCWKLYVRIFSDRPLVPTCQAMNAILNIVYAAKSLSTHFFFFKSMKKGLKLNMQQIHIAEIFCICHADCISHLQPLLRLSLFSLCFHLLLV